VDPDRQLCAEAEGRALAGDLFEPYADEEGVVAVRQDDLQVRQCWCVCE
jgi:hypothetical protein